MHGTIIMPKYARNVNYYSLQQVYKPIVLMVPSINQPTLFFTNGLIKRGDVEPAPSCYVPVASDYIKIVRV